jgi:hypothetical protein
MILRSQVSKRKVLEGEKRKQQERRDRSVLEGGGATTSQQARSLLLPSSWFCAAKDFWRRCRNGSRVASRQKVNAAQKE